MRIIFVIPALTIGGIEVLALRLAEAFGTAGHEVVLYDLSPEHQNAELLSRYDSRNFTIKSSKFTDWKEKPFWIINSILFKTRIHRRFRRQVAEWQFARFLRLKKFDVVCSLSFHEDYLACKHCRLIGLPVVISMHGTYEYAAPQWPDIAEYIYKNTKAIIYVADKNLEWYRKQAYFDAGMVINKVYTGLNINEPIVNSISRSDLAIAESDFVFIMVARGIPEKGWLSAIKSFVKLHSDFPYTSLLLVGDSEYLQQLKIEFGQEDGIIFYGSHTKPIELGRLANVGLLPTYFAIESLPSSIMEYLRCGLPVISTNIGEIKDMLSLPTGQSAGTILELRIDGHGVNVDELYDAMRRYLVDVDFYEYTSKLAQQAVVKFDVDASVHNYLEVFNQVIGK